MSDKKPQSRLRKYSRRAFLIGATAVAGGVAFGTYVVKRPHDNPLAADLQDGEATFNPYVKITGDRITLIASHTDKGQGVHHSQAALIAEELDVELDQVEISFGKPAPAYWNTGLANDAVPFSAFDESFKARAARGAVSSLGKVMGLMVTGGSSTMPDQFEKLRSAGAVARETLKAAAAQQTGVPVTQLKTARGMVILPDGTELPYTDLAATAASMEPVTDVALRDPSQWRMIGKPMQRVDVVAKSTGTLTYGIDLKVDGMVHAAAKVNPRQGGAMLSYDASAALEMPGVQKVLVLQGDMLDPELDGSLTRRRTKVGVAVIANNTWRAFQALEAIDIEWGSAPYPAEMDAHWQTLSDSFTEDKLDSAWRTDGDVEAALDGAEVLEAEYRAPYVAHAPLEPISAIVRADKDSAEVWVGHQMQRFAQMKVAAILGLDDPEKVTLHNQFIGGSFGHRLEFENVTIATEIARQMPGVPVKLTFSREEDFAHDFPRQIAMARGRGAAKDGKVDALDMQIAMPSVVASQMSRVGQPVAGPDNQIVAGAWNMPFDIPNLRVRGYRAPELAPISSWRSVGASSQGFFAEGFFDELCHAAGVDPLEERLRLVNNPLHRKALEAVGEMSNWGSALGPNRGRGIAMVESFGVPTAEVIEVTATEDGIKIDKAFVVAEVGRIVDPVNFENLMQGGVIWGLGHAMNCEITYSDGMAEQSNFDSHEGMRLYQCPDIMVRGLENGDNIRGIGEPPVPPAAPALANAIFAATGTRLREMPFANFVDFV
ncbi:xanthine dehydrogenase family protein molybdopterin-binding subunit [Thalassovita mediterranea]|jgi:isoquinoline 1-oxidoreductase beta subunit|uniref:Isoquinoline 1-oxidoreductase subunit beta n=1 Tax=Thalassovita mediterranea TaxID=340021 RepID=A0A0P1GTD1_9RHOB|nr:molybdopterin cofactor-binding domain-containing protein [Thalassovita mediterranea]CUH85908.1 Isoquinoline 1-oxidoreductase subunit beta [Thalassovita mediterranea]SIS32787.1 isoquinoline 1-oxidoreductase, beta subunit [Thalassovita mediterranea]